QLVIALQKDDSQADRYVVEGGDPAGVRTNDIYRALLEILPREPEPGKTFEEIVQSWPRETEPNRTSMYAALKAKARDGSIQCTGRGVKGDPYRYSIPEFVARPGTDSFARPTPPAPQLGDADSLPPRPPRGLGGRESEKHGSEPEKDPVCVNERLADSVP